MSKPALGGFWNLARTPELPQDDAPVPAKRSPKRPEAPLAQSVRHGQPLPIGADARDHARLTEAGNAARLFDKHGNMVRYVPELSAWLHWRDGAWQWDLDGASMRHLAAGLYHDIYDEGRSDFEGAEHYLKWARQSQQKRVIDATVNLLSDYAALRVPVTQLDADPLVVGLDGARKVLDLRNGTVRAARPDEHITRALGVSHLGNASEAVQWRSFLEQVFQGDYELIGWLQRFVGYALTGLAAEQIFLFLYGSGANGKSVFLDVLNKLLGDYARTIQPETLMVQQRNSSGASPDLVRLAGARLISGNETESGRALAESLLKQLVGGDVMAARECYGRMFEFRPVGKLLLAGNHRPVVRGTDDGVWRRIRLVPFSRQFSAEQRDPGLSGKLLRELAHIAAWALEGCIRWQAMGLQDVPASVVASTQDYRAEQDVLGQWLDERSRADPTASVGASEAYASYKTWAEASGIRPMSLQGFGRQLSERGFAKAKVGGCIIYRGFSLLPTPRYKA